MDRQDIIDTLADAWSKLDVLKDYDGMVHAAGDTDPVASIDIDALLDRLSEAEQSLRES